MFCTDGKGRFEPMLTAPRPDAGAQKEQTNPQAANDPTGATLSVA